MARACSAVGLLAGQHVEVVGGEAEIVPRLDRLVPCRAAGGRRPGSSAPPRTGRAPGRTARRRRCRGSGASRARRRARDTAVRSTSSGAPTRASAGSSVREPGRQRAPPADLVAEGRRGRRVGQLAPEQEVPDVLERARLGQVDGGVLPVVEEALLAAHVADGRLGHDDALEPGRDVPARLGGGPDAGDPHQVAQRDDADAAVALDHRQVAVVVRGEAGPGRVGPLVGTEHVGPGGHPQPHPLVVGVAGAGGGPQQVALGEDADDLAVVGHHDRAGVGLLHHPGRRRQGVVGAARHGGGGHEVAHDGFHASTMPLPPGVCKR